MPESNRLRLWRDQIETELMGNIVPFWLKHTIDNENGGFQGRISNDLRVDPEAEKGLILNTRILWTFSRLYRAYPDPIYRSLADRAYAYLGEHFWDRQNAGFYWMVDYRGTPTIRQKKSYGQAFAIYALSEYYRAFSIAEALQQAETVYGLLETYSHDPQNTGYLETFEEDWGLAGDQRLSEVDMDEKKSMNTHLHVLEGYANLLAAGGDDRVRASLRELITIFLGHIIDPETHHFRLFFTEEWEPRSAHISFGHDIEGSWLLCEAAEILGDEELLRLVEDTAVRMAHAVLREGLDTDGGLFYEGDGCAITDTDKHWWPQAEALVGFLNACRLTRESSFLAAAQSSWNFISTHIVDAIHGEWFWKVSRDGVPSQDRFKVDAWKGPYHNGRACLESMSRLDQLTIISGT